MFLNGLNDHSITMEQVKGTMLAIPAFLPACMCTGYVAAWLTNFHCFRNRSIVERLFWSLPLSLAVSPIAIVLLGSFFSLDAAVIFLVSAAVTFLGLVAWETGSQFRRRSTLVLGFRPYGSFAVALAIVWACVATISLVDIQSGDRLFLSSTIFDHAYRVNWTAAILHTGVPPSNPLYLYNAPAELRYYYFWNALCAAVAQMSHLSTRVVFMASCIWSGFALAALIGLFLKHLLHAGAILRKQFLLTIWLLWVTGFDIVPNLVNLFVYHKGWPLDPELWSVGQITSWLDSLLFVPHHVASLVCCMLALLLVSTDGERKQNLSTVILAGAALASAFGLSVYVTFAFFLVILAWSLWKWGVEHTVRPLLLMAGAGGVAGLLLARYLKELATSHSENIAGSRLFSFAIREMLPPETLLSSALLKHTAIAYPGLARNLANLVLLLPGYCLELGFYLLVLLVFLIPAWRGRLPVSKAHRSLIFIALVSFLPMTFIRSWVLESNDFGWRAALILQFSLLLLASELGCRWGWVRLEGGAPPNGAISSLGNKQRLINDVCVVAAWIGVVGTLAQLLVLRTYLPMAYRDPPTASRGYGFAHNANVSAVGYAELDNAIPAKAVVQYNPGGQTPFWTDVDMVGVNRQTVMFTDRLECGSLWGGDGAGCKPMTESIESVFHGANAEEAQSICKQWGIDYLVARPPDPAWNLREGWVWTLKPVVADPEFRALDCRTGVDTH